MTRKKIAINAIIFVNLILWLIPSNLTKLIARNKDILLGYYSIEKLTFLVILIPLSALAIYILNASEKDYRRRVFQVLLLLGTCFFGLIFIDTTARLVRSARYVETEGVYHRRPGQIVKSTFYDQPEVQNKKIEGNFPSGYSPVPYTLTVDPNGFRNQKVPKNSDIVTIGDSFTEGSKVSDDQSWPVLLSKINNKEVYNLGMSGGDPQDYLAVWKKYGLKLKPKTLICMVYEGNDFRGTGVLEDRLKPNASFSKQFRRYLKSSPIRLYLRRLMVKHLAPINSPYKNLAQKTPEILSWLPLKAPMNESGKYYNFAPKRLNAIFMNETEFASSAGWKSAALALKEIAKICQKHSIRFVVVYAPSKPTVALPVVKDQLPWEKVRAFMALRKNDLPPIEKFPQTLLEYIEVPRLTLQKFCKNENLEFISLTKALRDRATQGEQVYFTYDQHWSPTGQEVAAEVIGKYLEK